MGKEIREGELGVIALVGWPFLVVILISVGAYAGGLVGNRFGSQTIGTVIGVIFFAAISFYDLYRIATRIIRRYNRIDKETKQEKENSKGLMEQDEKSNDLCAEHGKTSDQNVTEEQLEQKEPEYIEDFDRQYSLPQAETEKSDSLKQMSAETLKKIDEEFSTALNALKEAEKDIRKKE